ncbi:MAG: tetratricopeptide repeat protein [Nitrospiraceae bacterium]
MSGYQAELSQDQEKAIREYQLALRGDPTSIFLKARIAVLLFSTGQIDSAVQFADRIPLADVAEATILVQLAGIYAGGGKAEKALALYDQAIQIEPRESDSYFSKGVLLVNLKRLDEAERTFEQGVEKAKDSPVGYYYLGRIEVEAKQFDRAVLHFERAISSNPTFEPAYTALASLYESQQERTKAIAVYRKYLQAVNPHSKEVRQHLVRLYLYNKSYNEALEELEKMLIDNPDDLDAQLRAGLIYGELKDYPKAIERLNKILGERPTELRIRDYLGLMYEEVKEYEKAIHAYETNLKIQPAYVEGHLHMGFLLYRLKRSEDALLHLSEAVRLNPKQADAHLLLGLTYLQNEQYALASRAFEQGILHNPENPDLHFNLGTAYDKLNRFDDVVRAMESTLRLDPKHTDALNYLGYSYAERGIKIPEAISLIKRAISLKPNNGYYVDSLGWALFKMGLLDEARAEITKATVLVKDDPVIYEHLGEIYLKQNLVQEAREAWLHSLELDPSNLKLIERYRERGFGDPTLEERIQQAKRRVSQNSSPTQATP